MNNKKVAHEWAFKNKPYGNGSNFFFEGETLYSYRRNYVLAKHYTILTLVRFTPYSSSTARHKSYALASLRQVGIEVVEVENPAPVLDKDHLENLDSLYEEAVDARDDYFKRRAGSAVKEHARNRYNQITKWMNKYAERFNIGDAKYQLETM
jgi:hypothetical protein